jgi:hypothetical protein
MESDNWQSEQARREIVFSWTKEQFVGLGKVSFDVGFGFEIDWIVIIGETLRTQLNDRDCRRQQKREYQPTRFHMGKLIGFQHAG